MFSVAIDHNKGTRNQPPGNVAGELFSTFQEYVTSFPKMQGDALKRVVKYITQNQPSAVFYRK